MAKLTPTQRKILENAKAGEEIYYPKGRSEHGGWSGSLVSCHRNGWLDRTGAITAAGLLALEKIGGAA